MKFQGATLAEADLDSLYREREAVEAAVERVATASEDARREAALRLSLDHPGIGSVGRFLNLSEGEQQALLIGLLPEGERREFFNRLLHRIGDDERLYRALEQVMPFSFPPPAALPKDQPVKLPAVQMSDVRIFPVGEPIEPLLTRLLFHLRGGALLPRPSFSRPVSGHLGGSPIAEKPQMQIELAEDGTVHVSGSDIDSLTRFRKAGLRLAIRDDAHLELEDGSQLYAEIFSYSGSSMHISRDPSQGAFQWHGRLDTWQWWRSDDVHYWVGFSPNARLPGTQNLVLTAPDEERCIGLHVPGEPTMTLLESNDHAGSSQHTGVFQVLQAGTRPLEELGRTRMANMSIALICSMALPPPQLFYGYNDACEICAVLGMRLSAPSELGLTDTPASCLFVPSLQGDWLRDHSLRIWLVPFLYRLRADLGRRRSSTKDLLYYFRTLLEDRILQNQIAKLGTAIRLLLHGEGTLRDDAYLDSGRVGDALRAFAQLRGVQLPENAVKALELSHRIALLGDRGISPHRTSTPPVELDELLPLLESLRVTVASLVAAMIGYTGPVYQGLAADHTSSRVHQPLIRPDEAARAADDRASKQIFSMEKHRDGDLASASRHPV